MSLLRKKLKQQNLLRSNLSSTVVLSVDGEDDEWEADDIIYVSYRRPEIVKDIFDNENDELPEHIRWKLFLARQLALAKYREAHG